MGALHPSYVQMGGHAICAHAEGTVRGKKVGTDHVPTLRDYMHLFAFIRGFIKGAQP